MVGLDFLYICGKLFSLLVEHYKSKERYDTFS